MPLKVWQRLRGDRGAIMAITALLLTTLIAVAAYALDTGIWYVHHNHLQTEADAAALAAATDYQCQPGTANTTVDGNISTTVHQYDGTTSGSSAYNAQVWASPTPASSYSSTGHNLFSLINQPNFKNQSTPNDSGMSGSPCADGSIDVKMTETNLPSVIPLIDPSYINAQARVSIERLVSSGNNEPMAIPSPAPSAIQAVLVDEGTGTQIGSPVTLTADNTGTLWTGSAGSVTFGSPVVGPVGLRVEVGGGAACGTQLACYDAGSTNGITYTRVWSATGIPGTGTPPVGPQAGDVTLSQPSSGACSAGAIGVFSNFIGGSSSACQVQLNATVYFAPGAVCGATPNVALSLSANGQTPAMSCTGATTVTTSPCSVANPCVATTWTSAAVALGADNPDGPIAFTMGWTQKFGAKPNGATGGDSSKPSQCTATKSCTASFGTVQRAFNGAYDQTSSGSSRSGPIIGATVTDASTGADLMSVQQGSSRSVNIAVNVLNLGFQNATSVAAGNPVVLHTGGSQGTYAIQCNGNNGSSAFTTYVATGCPQPFATTTQPNPPVCNTPQNPAVCVGQSPGTGKKVAPGINQRVNGSQSASTCVSPNYWTSANSLSQILDQNPTDPRLVQLLIVDSSAWVGVTGTSTQTPVRAIGTFYITGWSSSNGTGTDPCLASGQGTSGTNTSNGLAYIPDDDPGTNPNVLLGHFVFHNLAGSGGTGGGPGTCTAITFGDCVAILTK